MSLVLYLLNTPPPPGCSFNVDQDSDTHALFVDPGRDESISEADIPELQNLPMDMPELQNLSIHDSTDSPFSKRQKLSTPSRHTEATIEQQYSKEEDGQHNDAHEQMLLELTHMLPGVIDTLDQENQLDTFYHFNKMVYDGRFPMDNMAYLLFSDVCRFYQCSNTSAMRYSSVVKRFWRIGYRLFHGKWLRFMGGPKHGGSIISGDSERGTYEPEDGKINFAVPLRSIVSSDKCAISATDMKPGIINVLLDRVAEQSTPLKTYKICLDGKKINASTSGRHGDIDLWGHEQKPTLSERKTVLDHDKQLVDDASALMETLLVKRKVTTSELSEEETSGVKTLLIQLIEAQSKRIAQLRQARVNKELTLEKLKKEAGDDWRKSRLSYVISGLETALFDIRLTVRKLLELNDDICSVVAHLNGVPYAWKESKADLSKHSNYVHLNDDHYETTSDTRHVKQKSEKWFEIRKTAKETGSTLYSALGMETFKRQLEHFDQVMYNRARPEPTPSVKERMDYGTANEINAVATLVAKVLPVYDHTLKFVEEGCYRVTIGNVTMVVSPDGSCRVDPFEKAESAVEIKCPLPGKSFTTPVSYSLAKYYVPQVLAEMKVTHTDKLYFLSYSTESTTVQIVHFDENVWKAIEDEVKLIYDHDIPIRPTRRSPRTDELRKMIDSFVNTNVDFIAEIPSVKAVDCKNIGNRESIFCCHSSITYPDLHRKLDDVQTALHESDTLLDNAYRLSRTRATEFLGFMISDLDREYHSEQLHSVPIAYALKGYSMPTNVMREMLEEVLEECRKRCVYVLVCSFDGQWYKLVVTDRDDKPLTVHQLQKDVFADVRKMPKGDLVKRIGERNIVSASNTDELCEQIYIEKRQGGFVVNGSKSDTPIRMSKHSYQMIKEKTFLYSDDSQQRSNTDRDIDEILTSVPDTVFQQLTDELADTVTRTATAVAPDTARVFNEYLIGTNELFEQENDENAASNLESNDTDNSNCDDQPVQQPSLYDDVSHMLSSLQSDETVNKNGKWNISVESLRCMLSDAKSIDKCFTLNALKVMMKPVIGKLKDKGVKVNISSPKYIIVNVVSSAFGDGSNLQSRKRCRRTFPTLKALAKHAVQSIRKEHLNVVYSENIFPSRLSEWYGASPFGTELKIESVDCVGQKCWYSKPELNDHIGYYIFMILDAYHQICGARRLFCVKGIPAAGVRSQPLHEVAENSSENGCGLSTALVKDLIDRQSIAYAVQTFSEKVESALIEIGATEEANFCKLIRQWYNAEDEPGISAQLRCEYRLALREWLLRDVNFCSFPPNGAYVKDIHVVLYEGLLTGIERRLQLFPLTKSGCYNVRTIGSLDIENFFGSFQDIDTYGTGVLRPDSIANALSVAVELTDARMDPNRGFHMHTSQARVYPCKQYSNEMEIDVEDQGTVLPMNECVRDLSTINVRDHTFDQPERKRGKQKRKRGTISRPDEPARRPLPVREFHKAHEGKILPHVRRGLVLDDA